MNQFFDNFERSDPRKYKQYDYEKEIDNAVIEPADGPGVTYSKEHLSRKQIVPKIMEILQ